MKAVMIMHNAAIDADVTEVLESLGINCYSKFTDVLGKGQISEPHFNTDIWPGTNCGTFVVIDEAKAKQIMQNISRMREKLGTEGLKAFMWQIDDIT